MPYLHTIYEALAYDTASRIRTVWTAKTPFAASEYPGGAVTVGDAFLIMIAAVTSATGTAGTAGIPATAGVSAATAAISAAATGVSTTATGISAAAAGVSTTATGVSTGRLCQAPVPGQVLSLVSGSDRPVIPHTAKFPQIYNFP